ncbi:MAG: bifunctional phosphoribosylaminoimidazolecarboxamide formyltransferase/IMP cyclohydrolase [Sulfobacillus sp.]
MRALISTYDKSDAWVALARGLCDRQWQVLATHGTAVFLESQGVTVSHLEHMTGISSLMGGRVKTLHPAVHAGLLWRGPADLPVVQELGGQPIDLLAVSLYPFSEVRDQGAAREAVIEMIDVGGPAMLRAAAKNHQRVTPLCDVADVPQVLAAIDDGTLTALGPALAAKVFATLSAYDQEVSDFLTASSSRSFALHLSAGRELRYGENPHQQAVAYGPWPQAGPDLLAALVREGKPVSANNLFDAEAALWTVAGLPQPAAAVIKHQTPAGVARGSTLAAAYQRALEADWEAAYGGVAAVNQELDLETAKVVRKRFLEVLVAPSISAAAQELLADRAGLRLLVVPKPWVVPHKRLRSVGGQVLVEDWDDPDLAVEPWQLVAGQGLPGSALADLELAWSVARMAKSNAVVLVKDGATVGIGSGQVSRVRAAEQAIAQAAQHAHEAVAASDGFIPFPDLVTVAQAAGVRAIVQPGGSKGDADVIEAATRAGMTMYLTGIRHFRH